MASSSLHLPPPVSTITDKNVHINQQYVRKHSVTSVPTVGKQYLPPGPTDAYFPPRPTAEYFPPRPTPA